MSVFQRQIDLDAPVGELAAWHARPGALQRLMPPWDPVEVLQHEGIEDGARAVVRLRFGPVPVRWELVHENDGRGAGFVDRQVRGPFRSWRHHHEFLSRDDGARLRDSIDYALPLGALGRAVAGAMTERRLDTLFRFRHRVTRLDLESPCAAFRTGPWRIAVTGAGGFLGREVVALARSLGHEVVPLVRRAVASGSGEVAWDPEQGLLADPGALDAVVHLAGEPLLQPWTPAGLERIRHSRVHVTRRLVQSLAGLPSPPPLLISASLALGDGTEDEGPAGSRAAAAPGFLDPLLRDAEDAAHEGEAAGLRVVLLRLGHVLGPGGGLLGRMVPGFRAGLGGSWGDGEQELCWVSLDDAAQIALECVRQPGLRGPVHAVAPRTVTVREFARTLGRVLHRPVWLHRSTRWLRRQAGAQADEVWLRGSRREPRKLLSHGYRHRSPDLEDALRHYLGAASAGRREG